MRVPRKNHGPLYFRNRLQGCLGNNWSGWFEDMAVSCTGSETILAGPVADQSALHGLLDRIRDLNLNLLSVERLELEREIKNKS